MSLLLPLTVGRDLFSLQSEFLLRHFKDLRLGLWANTVDTSGMPRALIDAAKVDAEGCLDAPETMPAGSCVAFIFEDMEPLPEQSTFERERAMTLEEFNASVNYTSLKSEGFLRYWLPKEKT